MAEPSATHATFVLERAFTKPSARIFAAFADPVQKRRWFAESPNHEILEFALDFRAGGAERQAYRMTSPPIAGAIISSDARYLDIQPDTRIVIAQTMDINGQSMSAALITFEFLAENDGTTLICTHQGAFFAGADGPALREHGWVVLLDQLAAECA